MMFKSGHDSNNGGYSRLYSAIKTEREKALRLLLIDAGIFPWHIFQTYCRGSSTIKNNGEMDYDVTTLAIIIDLRI